MYKLNRRKKILIFFFLYIYIFFLNLFLCNSRQNEGSEPRALKLGDLSTKPEYINRKKGLRFELGPRDPSNSCLKIRPGKKWQGMQVLLAYSFFFIRRN